MAMTQLGERVKGRRGIDCDCTRSDVAHNSVNAITLAIVVILLLCVCQVSTRKQEVGVVRM